MAVWAFGIEVSGLRLRMGPLGYAWLKVQFCRFGELHFSLSDLGAKMGGKERLKTQDQRMATDN